MAGHIASAGKVEWMTPPVILDRVRGLIAGAIGLDPCGNEHSHLHAEREYRLPTNGLLMPWRAPSIFVNPPFGRTYLCEGKAYTPEEFAAFSEQPENQGKEFTTSTIASWAEKCAAVGRARGDSQVFLLIPAAVDTAHWQEIVFASASAVCFFSGRLHFLDEQGEDAGPAPMACALVYWGDKPHSFRLAFKSLGATLVLRESA